MQTTPDTWKSLNNCCSGTNDSTIWNCRTPVSRPCWPLEVGTSALPRWRPCWLQRRIDRSSSRRASNIWGRGTLTVWIWISSIREAEEVPQRTSTGSPHLFRYTRGHEGLCGIVVCRLSHWHLIVSPWAILLWWLTQERRLALSAFISSFRNTEGLISTPPNFLGTRCCCWEHPW